MDDPGRAYAVPWDRALESKFAFLEALELPYLDASWRRPGRAEAITFVCRACAAPVRKISGYDFLYVNYQAAPGAAPQDIAGSDADAVVFSFDAEAGILRFVPRAAPELAMDLGAHFRGLRERYPEAYDLNLPEEEMVLTGEDKTLKVSVRMRRLSGEAGDAVQLREFEGDLLVRTKGKSRPRD